VCNVDLERQLGALYIPAIEAAQQQGRVTRAAHGMVGMRWFMRHLEPTMERSRLFASGPEPASQSQPARRHSRPRGAAPWPRSLRALRRFRLRLEAVLAQRLGSALDILAHVVDQLFVDRSRHSLVFIEVADLDKVRVAPGQLAVTDEHDLTFAEFVPRFLAFCESPVAGRSGANTSGRLRTKRASSIST
jgi:hypothetical protein